MKAGGPPYSSSTTRARTADQKVPEKGRLSFGGSNSGRPEQSKLLREENALSAHPVSELKGRKISRRVVTESSSQKSPVVGGPSLFHPPPHPSFTPPTSSPPPPLPPPSSSSAFSVPPVPTPPAQRLSPSSLFKHGQEGSKQFSSSSAKGSTLTAAIAGRSTSTTVSSNPSTNENPNSLEFVSDRRRSSSSNDPIRSSFPAGIPIGWSASSSTSPFLSALPSSGASSVVDSAFVKATAVTIHPPLDNHSSANHLNVPHQAIRDGSSTSGKNAHGTTVTPTSTQSGDGQESTRHPFPSPIASVWSTPAIPLTSPAVPRTPATEPSFSSFAAMQKVLEEKNQYILQLESTVKALQEKLKEVEQQNISFMRHPSSTASTTPMTTTAATSIMMKPTKMPVTKRDGGEEEENARTSSTMRRKSSGSIGVRPRMGEGEIPYPALTALAPPPSSHASSHPSGANDLPMVRSKNGTKSLVGNSMHGENRSSNNNMSPSVAKERLILPQSTPSTSVSSGLSPPSPSRRGEGSGDGEPAFAQDVARGLQRERSGSQSGSLSTSSRERTPSKSKVQEWIPPNVNAPVHWRTANSAATLDGREGEREKGRDGLLHQGTSPSVSSQSSGKKTPAPLPLYSVTTVTPTASSLSRPKGVSNPLPSDASSGRRLEEEEDGEKTKRSGEDENRSQWCQSSSTGPPHLPLPLLPSPRERTSSSRRTSSNSCVQSTSGGSSLHSAPATTASRQTTHRPSVADIIAEEHRPREKRKQEAQDGLLWCIENTDMSDGQEADPAGVEYCVRSGADVCGVIPNPEYDLLPIYFYFIKSGNVRCLQACLKTERPIDFTLTNENDGCTALIEAVRLPQLTDVEAILQAIVRRILQRGVNASKSEDVDLLELLEPPPQRPEEIEVEEKAMVEGKKVPQQGRIRRSSSASHRPFRSPEVSGALHESAATTTTSQATAVDTADSHSPPFISTLSSSSTVSLIPSRRASLGSSAAHSLFPSYSSPESLHLHYHEHGDVVDWLQADYGGRHMFTWAARLGRLAAVWSIVRWVPYFIHKKHPIPLYGPVGEKDWEALGADGQQHFGTQNNH